MRVQITPSEVGDLNYSLVDFRMSRAMKFSYPETATLSFTVHVAGESTTENVCVHCEVNLRVKGS